MHVKAAKLLIGPYQNLLKKGLLIAFFQNLIISQWQGPPTEPIQKRTSQNQKAWTGYCQNLHTFKDDLGPTLILTSMPEIVIGSYHNLLPIFYECFLALELRVSYLAKEYNI